MNTRPPPQKRTHPKHTGRGGHQQDAEQSWLRHFIMFLVAIGIIAAVAVFYYNNDKGADADEDAYIPIQIKTLLASNKMVSCKLDLQIDPEQEKGLQPHRKVMETVISQQLTDLYTREQRPEMSEVRQSLYFAVNQKLPRKLQVRDVLIQELTVGYRP